MKKPGFPLSTLALVAIMVGALFMVSKQVTPPPAMPPVEAITPASVTVEPKKESTAEDKAKQADQMKKMKKYYEDKMKKEAEDKVKEMKAQQDVMRKSVAMGKETGQKPSRYDPTNTNIDAKYFGDMPMGSEGIKATDQAVALATAAKEKLRQEAAAKEHKNKAPDSTSATPTSK